MHIEKKVCDVVRGTLMNILGKTKDDKVVQHEIECNGLRLELWPQVKMGKKRNRAKDEGGSNKGKGKQKVTK